MTIQIGGLPIADWAPGSLAVSLGGGVPGATLAIAIDGTATGQTWVFSPDGSVPELTVMLPSLVVGTHALSVTTSTGDSGTVNFQVLRNPAPAPVAPAAGSPAAQVEPARWQFEDPITNDIYVLPVNPKSAGAPFGARRITESTTTTGQPISAEGNEVSTSWVMAGFIRNEAEYDALYAWAKKAYRIWVTDDLGRQYVGVITSFAPSPLAPHSSGSNWFRGNYDMHIELGLT